MLAPWFRGAVRTGGPNAGHTFVWQGTKYVARGIPCAWINPYCDLIIGAGAIVNRGLLIDEAEHLPLHPNRRIYVDRAAACIPPEAEAAERNLSRSIGSTAEGVGYTRIAKIKREDTGLLAGSQEWPARFQIVDTVALLNDYMRTGQEVMLEGTQGAGLSIHHGIAPGASGPSDLAWPFATSNDTNAAQMLADAGIAPTHLEHTLMVARSYPIRVGGNSGNMGDEVDWSEIPGGPTPEKTTVTKKQRRIARWNDEMFDRAVILNAPCGVILTFADYLDPDLYGETDPRSIMMSAPVRDLIRRIESRWSVPVVSVGTGGDRYVCVEMSDCAHGRYWQRENNNRRGPGRFAATAAR